MLMTLALPGSGVSFAADKPDHDRARQAVEAGDVLPLRTILDRLEHEYPGQVMEVELDREKGEWVYEIKLLRKGGILMKLKVGYVVDVAHNGVDGHFMGETQPYDAIVLDIGLPQMDGITVLKKWRASGRTLPVLILTARDTWREKVAGIDAGADDYLTKPFHMEELLARLRALIRRAGGHASTEFVCGPLTLDTRSSRASVDGTALTLTSHEYRVLAYLMHHPGEIVSRAELTEHIYAQDFDRDSNTVEVFIARLRKKLPPGLIETVRGLGYRLNKAQ
jgi:two-component system OmpR family response regulator